MTLILVVLCLLICGACERVLEEERAPLVPIKLGAVPPTTTLPAPVFDLATAEVDVAQAASNGVQVSALDDLCILEYERAGAGLRVAAKHLPRGNAPRTLFVMLRAAAPAPAVLVGYGVAGTIGAMSALSIDHAARLSFWGYGADVWQDTTVPTQRWTSLAATYNGTNLTLYVDGETVKSATYALNTAPGMLCMGEKLVGAISDVRIWDRALSADEVKSVHASSLARLR